MYDKNLFAYCDNNPVTRKDETGDVWILVGAVFGGISSAAVTALTGGKRNEIITAAIFGAASGALAVAIPGYAALIDIGLGAVEELTTSIVKRESYLEASVGITSSVGVDTVSNLISEESSLTKETMRDFTNSWRKVKKGNHPKIKKEANKIVKTTSKTIAKEAGTAFAGKTIGTFFKNIIKKLF